ncbi:MAG: hypothetical protein KatS3mg034_2093 [Vicingaceae bacterium]|nr:MAG: hypothetical protein KatS3mg034_2093 [Vicingaceae bacterium]
MNTIYFNNLKTKEIKDKVIGLIEQANFEIVLLAYRFTNEEIFEALVKFLIRTEQNPKARIFVGIDKEAINSQTANQNLSNYQTKNGFDEFQTMNNIESRLLELKNKYKNKVYIKLFDNVELMHHKILIIDREYLGTGSFNFTYQAHASNFENFFITSSKYSPYTVAKALKEAFEILEIPYFEEPLENPNVSIKPCLVYDNYVKTISHTKNNTIIYPQSAEISCSANNCMKIEIEFENFSETIPNYHSKIAHYECVLKFKEPKSGLLKVRFYGWDGKCCTIEKIIEIRPKWPISADEVKVITTNYENMARKAMHIFDQILMKHKNNPYGKR